MASDDRKESFMTSRTRPEADFAGTLGRGRPRAVSGSGELGSSERGHTPTNQSHSRIHEVTICHKLRIWSPGPKCGTVGSFGRGGECGSLTMGAAECPDFCPTRERGPVTCPGSRRWPSGRLAVM